MRLQQSKFSQFKWLSSRVTVFLEQKSLFGFCVELQWRVTFVLKKAVALKDNHLNSLISSILVSDC